MRGKFPVRFILGLALVAGMGGSWLMAQPFGPKGPSGRAPVTDSITVRGTVQSFTSAPKGEVDGLILADGTWVHWPPHLADRFSAIVAKGDQVKAIGFMETGPKGDTKLEVSTLTNVRTGRTSDNPDRPVAVGAGSDANFTVDGAKTVRGTVQSFTSAPKGEVDGLILADGTWVHWPPHLADRFSAIVAKGDQVKAIGFMETGPKGDTKLEASTLTNARTGRTSDNPDRPVAVAPARADGFEVRLQALENQLDQLRKEIERLRRER